MKGRISSKGLLFNYPVSWTPDWSAAGCWSATGGTPQVSSVSLVAGKGCPELFKEAGHELYTTGPEAGEGNSQIRFRRGGTPLLGLEEREGIHLYCKLTFTTPQVRMETRMKETDRPIMPPAPYILTCQTSTFLPAFIQRE